MVFRPFPQNRSLIAAFALSGWLIFAAPAGAAAMTEMGSPRQPWQTGVIQNPDNSFAYCVTETPFTTGLWLLMALNPAGEFNLGVGQPKAGLPVGSERMVSITIDQNPAIIMKAKATKPELMVINGGTSGVLLQAISRGSEMEIDGLRFSLTGTGQALKTLQACVAAKGQPPAEAQMAAPHQPSVQPPQSGRIVYDDRPSAMPAPQASQPSQGVLATTRPMSGSVPNDLKSAAITTMPSMAPAAGVASAVAGVVKPLPTPLLTLLTKAGLNTAQPAAVGAGSSYAWQSRDGQVKGNVQEQKVPAGTDLGQLVRLRIAGDAALCAGEFATAMGKVETASGLKIQKLDTTCTVAGQLRESSAVYVLADGGVLSVISHEATGRNSASALGAGLVKALMGK
jgi:hypothetical protein